MAASLPAETSRFLAMRRCLVRPALGSLRSSVADVKFPACHHHSFLKRIRFAFESSCVVLFGGLVRLLPRRGAMALGAAIGAIAHLVLRHDRLVARANLDLVLGDAVSPAQ